MISQAHLRISDLLPNDARVAPRRSLSDEAADTLRELILLEKLAPGMAFSERDLAEGMGISRTPLKEAIRVLESEGLIEYGPTRRPYVANPTVEELAQNLQVLGALESLAGELACTAATDAEIAEVAALCEQMNNAPEALDPLEYFKLDMAFHRKIIVAARNAPLIATHAQYNARLWRARFISSKRRGGRNSALGQHIDIIDALRRRDATETARQMRRHLETTVVNITAAYETAEQS